MFNVLIVTHTATAAARNGSAEGDVLSHLSQCSRLSRMLHPNRFVADDLRGCKLAVGGEDARYPEDLVLGLALQRLGRPLDLALPLPLVPQRRFHPVARRIEHLEAAGLEAANELDQHRASGAHSVRLAHSAIGQGGGLYEGPGPREGRGPVRELTSKNSFLPAPTPRRSTPMIVRECP